MIGSAARRRLAPVLAFAASVAIPSSAAAAPKVPNLGLGYEYDLSGEREEFLLPDPIVDPSVVPDHPLYVRIRAPWSLLEASPGVYDWSEVDRIVGPYRAASFVVVRRRRIFFVGDVKLLRTKNESLRQTPSLTR